MYNTNMDAVNACEGSLVLLLVCQCIHIIGHLGMYYNLPPSFFTQPLDEKETVEGL
jgi:hypothetical protein